MLDVRNQLKEVKPETWQYDLIIDSHSGGRGLPIPPELSTSTHGSPVFIFVEAL